MHKPIKLFIGLLICFAAAYNGFSQNIFSRTEKLKTDWLFVYYMPYDNNLSENGEIIIKLIADNIQSENVIVAIQAEFADSPGMKRYLITNKGIAITDLDNKESASIRAYQEYLKWVKGKIAYNKLAVVFLDHGGKLDEVCLDEKPIMQFLKVDEINSVFLDVFGKNSIDLLFLQTCVKGVLEALYEFRDTAKYTLASQYLLGAPNSYYEGLFSAFSDQTITTGRDIAELIADNEAVDMYNSYTLVDNSKMEKLYTLFSEYIAQMQNGNRAVSITGYTYHLKDSSNNTVLADERYWDVISFLKSKPETANREGLITYIQNELIVFHRINPRRSGAMSRYSGLSISGATDNRYDRLKFYKLLQPIRELQ